jgi:hypothetical protein
MLPGRALAEIALLLLELYDGRVAAESCAVEAVLVLAVDVGV